VVVRGPAVKEIRIAALHPAGASAMMAVEVTITGPRYIEDRATAAVVAGNPARSSTFLERWTFGLQDDPAQPWRIVAVDSPVAAR
jgi:predicted lipid-binding transport protein (Tim44 family)